MTAKNRIILSVIAIITTLVVAGSMVFIIFAATRGTVNGGVTITYDRQAQVYGKVTTRYTQVPISQWGNGEGDQVMMTTGDNPQSYVEFKGWADPDNTQVSLAPINLTLTLENPWVIFYTSIADQNGEMMLSLSLASGTTYSDNIEIGVRGQYEEPSGGVSLDSVMNVDQFNSIWYLTNTTDYVGTPGISDLYYYIRVTDTSKDAYFSGGIVCNYVNTY